jgi:integrase
MLTTTQVKILVPGRHDMVRLVGARDEFLKLIEAAFSTHVLVRGNEITLTGETQETERVSKLFQELVSLLDYFASEWPGVGFAPAFAKVIFWSWARREEVSSLRWSDERRFGAECHFESTGKWAVRKWFRIPDALRSELEALRTESDFVFGCYPDQLREFYSARQRHFAADRIRRDFSQANLGEWMYRQVRAWSSTLPGGSAYLHVFRKTALQHALSGEHIDQVVAQEAQVTARVMRAIKRGQYPKRKSLWRGHESSRGQIMPSSTVQNHIAWPRVGPEEWP